MKHYAAMCAIVRYESKYIEEWLRFHAKLGVEHFYIYDHFSETYTMDLVRGLGSSTIIDWSRNMPGSPQRAAYEHCYKTYRTSARWIGFFDIDEFVVPNTLASIPDMLADYEQYSGVGFHWKLFGNNGHEKYSPEPVVERFTRCEVGVNPHIKCFVDPTLVNGIVTAHKFTHSVGTTVDENFIPIAQHDSTPPDGTVNVCQINHYITKSREECEFRRSKPRVDTNNFAEREMKSFWEKHNRNEVEDFRARDLWRK